MSAAAFLQSVMMYDEIIRFFKWAMAFILALAMCAIIHTLCGCARKTTSVAEDYTRVTATDSVHLTDSFTNRATDTQSWWIADAVTTTYSEPDSTGKQYITSTSSIQARGGTIIHDTITITLHDTTRVCARDSIIYKYKEKTTKTGNILSYIITFIVILALVLIGIRYRITIIEFFHRFF